MFSIKGENKVIKFILLLSCSLLFFSIIFCIFHYGNSLLLGNFYEPDNDDVKFIRSAWNLVQTGVYTYHKPPAPTVFMMPGLSYTLGFFMLIFGKFGGITALRIVQAIVQVLSLLLIFFIARKLFNSKVGAAAVVLNVLCVAEIWVPTLVLTETFFKFFVLCLMYFSIYALEKNKVKYYVWGGVFLALATLFRPTIATFPILILIMWVIKRVRFKDAVKYTAAVMIVFVMILSPWWVRNYNVFHRFIPLTLASGNPMWQGTYINYDRSTMATDGLDYTNYDNHDPKLTEIERNDMETALSKYRLTNLFPRQPLQFIYWYTIGKGWIQIKSPFYWYEVFGISFTTAKNYHSLLLILCLAGIILYLREKNKNILAVLPIITIAYFIVVYLPFFTMGRYFYPAVPFLAIFAGYFIVNFKNLVYIFWSWT